MRLGERIGLTALVDFKARQSNSWILTDMQGPIRAQ